MFCWYILVFLVGRLLCLVSRALSDFVDVQYIASYESISFKNGGSLK